MSKYAVGDVVMVRDDLVAGRTYKMEQSPSGWLFVDDMCKFLGEAVTIAEADEGHYYIVEGDYYWTDEMFSCLSSETHLYPPDTTALDAFLFSLCSE